MRLIEQAHASGVAHPFEIASALSVVGSILGEVPAVIGSLMGILGCIWYVMNILEMRRVKRERRDG